VDDNSPQFYRRNAGAYARWAKAPSTRLVDFLGSLPPAAHVLELGCGAGNHLAEMLARGFSRARHRWLAGNGRGEKAQPSGRGHAVR
jgi:hypothetical protein